MNSKNESSAIARLRSIREALNQLKKSDSTLSAVPYHIGNLWIVVDRRPAPILEELHGSEKGRQRELVVLDRLRSRGFSAQLQSNRWHERGAPDIIAKDSQGIFFVEVKGHRDGIKFDQIEWMLGHASARYLVYCIG